MEVATEDLVRTDGVSRMEVEELEDEELEESAAAGCVRGGKGEVETPESCEDDEGEVDVVPCGREAECTVVTNTRTGFAGVSRECRRISSS